MRLRQTEIEGYRSVRKKLKLVVGDRTTVLLGANDHGKTNVLEALRHMNADEPFSIDDLNWDCASDSERLPHVTYTFELERAEREEMAETITSARRREAARQFSIQLEEAAVAAEETAAAAQEAAGEAEARAATARAELEALGAATDPPSDAHQLAGEAVAEAVSREVEAKAGVETPMESARRARALANLALADEYAVLAELRGEEPEGAAERAHDAATQEASRLATAAKRAATKAANADQAHQEAVAAGQAQDEITQLMDQANDARAQADQAEQRAADARARADELAPVAAAATAAREKKLSFPKDQTPPRPEVFRAEKTPERLVLERVGVEGDRTVRPVRDLPEAVFHDFVRDHLPKVELIGPEQKVEDVATPESLSAPDNDFMRGIFRYAGLPPEEWSGIFVQTPATTKRLDEASDQLNSTLRESWSQGANLTFRLRHHGGEIDLEIHDPSVSTQYVRASRRSAGFTHFFALKTILFAREQASGASKFIWLFDEPGLYLHPQGEHDLLQVLETLSLQNQVLYTTHSIFLLNKNHPTRHRLLKKDENGTSIDAKPYSGRWKAAIDSLGLALPGTVLFAQKVLLVEGDSDPIFINATLQKLIEIEAIDIDLNALSVIATGDMRHADALIRMLTEAALKPEIAILVDGDSGGAARIKGLKKLIAANKIKTSELDPGTAVEDHLLLPDELLPKALSDYLGQLEACALSADEAGNAVRTSWDARTEKDNRAGALAKIGEEVGGLDEPPSKVGIARQYLLALAELERDKFQPKALKRPVALAETIRELLNLPSETVSDTSIVA